MAGGFRARQLLTGLVSWVAVAAAPVGCSIPREVAGYYGLAAGRENPEQLADRLRPYQLRQPPEGEPNGIVLIVPGCLGIQGFHRAWANFVLGEGWAVLLLDSFGPRQMAGTEGYRDVCEGRALWGSERAGDVLVTLDFLRREHGALAERVVLLGWSHGGWAVMDAVAYGSAGRRTPNLRRLPDAPLAGVRAVAAFYPYCGFGTSALRFGWPEGLTALLLVGKRDTNIDPDRCLEVVARLRQEGVDFESVVYDADHWFDNPDGQERVPHV